MTGSSCEQFARRRGFRDTNSTLDFIRSLILFVVVVNGFATTVLLAASGVLNGAVLARSLAIPLGFCLFGALFELSPIYWASKPRMTRAGRCDDGFGSGDGYNGEAQKSRMATVVMFAGFLMFCAGGFASIAILLGVGAPVNSVPMGLNCGVEADIGWAKSWPKGETACASLGGDFGQAGESGNAPRVGIALKRP